MGVCEEVIEHITDDAYNRQGKFIERQLNDSRYISRVVREWYFYVMSNWLRDGGLHSFL